MAILKKMWNLSRLPRPPAVDGIKIIDNDDQAVKHYCCQPLTLRKISLNHAPLPSWIPDTEYWWTWQCFLYRGKNSLVLIYWDPGIMYTLYRYAGSGIQDVASWRWVIIHDFRHFLGTYLGQVTPVVLDDNYILTPILPCELYANTSLVCPEIWQLYKHD